MSQYDQGNYPPLEPWRVGIKGRCPRCGEGKLFDGFLTNRAPLHCLRPATTHLPTRPMARPFCHLLCMRAVGAVRRLGGKSPSSHRLGSMPSSRYRSSLRAAFRPCGR